MAITAVRKFSSANLLALFTLITLCNSLQTFQQKIPNGDSVPNTCATNEGDKWGGVGHIAITGGGVRNVFGLAFKAADLMWTADFCGQDSDGDGMSNGEELGDPDCVWTEAGGASPASEAKGHPAICEPVTSEDCKAKNTWIASCAAANVTVTTSAVTPTTSAASGLTIASGVITTILVTAQTLI